MNVIGRGELGIIAWTRSDRHPQDLPAVNALTQPSRPASSRALMSCVEATVV